MKKVVLDFVNKLEGYKTAVKSLHWSSSNMSEHELFDKIADSVKDIQDVVSESEQGMTSPLANNKLKPIPYKITTSKKFLDDLSKTAIEFRNKINGDDYIGMRSAVEAFISEVDVFKYQLTICLKEDFERRMNRNRVRLTESQLHRVIQEAVTKVLKEVKLTNPESGKELSLHGYYDDDNTDKGGLYSNGQPVSKTASDYYTLAALRNKQALRTPGAKINNPKHNRAFKTANDAAMANSRGDKWGKMNQARENGQNRANNYMQK